MNIAKNIKHITLCISMLTLPIMGVSRLDTFLTDREEVSAAYEQLCESDKVKISKFFDALEVILTDFEASADEATNKHQEATDLLRKILNIDKFAIAVGVAPISDDYDAYMCEDNMYCCETAE